ncbi:MAG: SxtJ family membrane protein [Magnetovibrionaceae bacterium]
MARKSENLHEDLDRDDEVKVGSEKSFGIVFAVVFVIIGLLPLISGGAPRIWSLSLAAAFLILGFFMPKALTPLNILWFKFGLLLHKIINPLIMGLLFFLTVTPIGLIMRLLGKRPLNLPFEPEAETYWIKRDPPGPDPKQMSKQF